MLAAAAVGATQQGWSALAQSSDDHPYFTDEYQVREGEGSARISVVRDSSASAETVRYATKPSDAKAGADFLPVSGELVFPAGDRGPKTFEVPIVDDGEPEEDETVLLLLYDSAGKEIDFSELVIQSNEAIPPDEGEVAGPGPGEGSPTGLRNDPAGLGGRQAGRGSSGPGSNPNPAAVPPQALAPGEIPTIVLGTEQPTEQPTGSQEATQTATGRPASAASPDPGRSMKWLLALSAAMVLAGGGALLWLRTKEKRPPAA